MQDGYDVVMYTVSEIVLWDVLLVSVKAPLCLAPVLQAGSGSDDTHLTSLTPADCSNTPATDCDWHPSRQHPPITINILNIQNSGMIVGVICVIILQSLIDLLMTNDGLARNAKLKTIIIYIWAAFWEQASCLDYILN